MARPIKHIVDYFSHDADASEGKTLTILENNFGLEGYAAWFKLLERLSKAENHVMKCRNSEDIEFLAAKLRLQPDKTKLILQKMADLGAIDSDLYSKGIIWSQNFVARLKDVYDNRKQDLPQKPTIDITTPNNDIINHSLPQETPLPSVESTQSKVKDSEGNNTLPEKAIELASLLKELILTNNPKALLKENILTTWGKTFDLMLSNDKRDPKDIEAVIRWCQADSFEKSKVLSADKVRSRFDSLYMEMNSKGNGHKQQAPASKYQYVKEEADDDN